MSHDAREADGGGMPSVAIVGADALLAVRPATPVQLAHACLALGYQAVFPASWGDELVAAACLARLGAMPRGPALLCSCPFVADRVESAPEIAPAVVALQPPPVAAARYLRALHGAPLRITYIGGCPAAEPPDVDARLSPVELLAELAARGIDAAREPEAFDSVIPPDRRRFWSLAGGAPAPEALARAETGRALVEIGTDDLIALAQQLLSRECVLVDPAPGVGCMCSGAVAGRIRADARAEVAALEPPRSPTPVVDAALAPTLDRPFPQPAPATPDAISLAEVHAAVQPEAHAPEVHPSAVLPPEAPAPCHAAEPTGEPTQGAAAEPAPEPITAPSGRGRRAVQTPVSSRRPVGAAPVLRTERGSTLPRAYVARRRTPPRGEASVTATAPERASVFGSTGAGALAPESAPAPESADAPDRTPAPESASAMATAEAPPVESSGEAPVSDAGAPGTTEPAAGGDHPEPVDETAESRGARGTRAVVVPLPSERPEPVPPPAARRSRALLLLGGAAALVAAALLLRLLAGTLGAGRTPRAGVRDSAPASRGSEGGARSTPAPVESAAGGIASSGTMAGAPVPPATARGAVADAAPGGAGGARAGGDSRTPAGAGSAPAAPVAAAAPAAPRRLRERHARGRATTPDTAATVREQLERREARFDSLAQLADSLGPPPERR